MLRYNPEQKHAHYTAGNTHRPQNNQMIANCPMITAPRGYSQDQCKGSTCHSSSLKTADQKRNM
jgi:hypothetical protein